MSSEPSVPSSPAGSLRSAGEDLLHSHSTASDRARSGEAALLALAAVMLLLGALPVLAPAPTAGATMVGLGVLWVFWQLQRGRISAVVLLLPVAILSVRACADPSFALPSQAQVATSPDGRFVAWSGQTAIDPLRRSFHVVGAGSPHLARGDHVGADEWYYGPSVALWSNDSSVAVFPMDAATPVGEPHIAYVWKRDAGFVSDAPSSLALVAAARFHDESSEVPLRLTWEQGSFVLVREDGQLACGSWLSGSERVSGGTRHPDAKVVEVAVEVRRQAVRELANDSARLSSELSPSLLGMLRTRSSSPPECATAEDLMLVRTCRFADESHPTFLVDHGDVVTTGWTGIVPQGFPRKAQPYVRSAVLTCIPKREPVQKFQIQVSAWE